MIFFPLGLAARVRDFPWFSLLVVMVTAYLSIVLDHRMHEYHKYLYNLPAEQVTQWRLRALKAERCHDGALPADGCQVLKDSLKDDKPRNIVQYYAQLRTAAAKGTQAEEILAYLNAPLEAAEAADAQEYVKARAVSDPLIQDFQYRNSILTPLSAGLVPLTLAQFTHSGWMHLIFNMVFLLAFAVFVEQYLGAGKTALIYFVGGSLGLLAQLAAMPGDKTPLIGASANVFAVAGAFLILFWRQKITVFASVLFFLNKRVQTPVWAYFLAFVIMNEVTGAVRASESGTAHLAHLGGFVVGVALAWHWTKARSLPDGFVFPYEVSDFETLKNLTDSNERRTLLKTLLFHNQMNRTVLQALCEELSRGTVAWHDYPPATRELITQSAREQMSEMIETQKFNDLAQLIGSLKDQWPIAELLPELSEYRRVRLMKAVDSHPARAELAPLLEKKVA